MDLTVTDVLVRLGVAAGLGAIIGIEREARGHPAGFRTLMVLSVASALVMILSYRLGTADYTGQGLDSVRTDPARLAAQAVSGVGFLGAGVILRMGLTVHGLTTAAIMWAVAGLGLASGAGYITDALIATGIIFLALLLMPPVERKLLRSLSRRIFTVRAKPRPNLVEEVSAALRAHGQRLEHLDLTNTSDEQWEMMVTLRRTSAGQNIDPSVVLLGVEGVIEVIKAESD